MKDEQIPGAMGDRAAIYERGAVAILAKFPLCKSGTTATSINSLGEAVGTCLGSTKRFQHLSYALYFKDGSVTEMAGSGPNQDFDLLEPLQINDTGVILGLSDPRGNMDSAPSLVRFYRTGEGATPIGGPKGECYAVFLNKHGDFAFTHVDKLDSVDFASLGHGTEISELFPRKLHTFATGINDTGHVIGYIKEANQTQAYIRTSGGTKFIPFLKGHAAMIPSGINDAGDVVGNPGGAGIFLYSSGHVNEIVPLIKQKGYYGDPIPGLSASGAFVTPCDSGYCLVTPAH